MELWINKNLCTGCGACSNVCPKKAITMVEDKNGFKYPVIDQKLCINCGLCKKTCPVFENKISNKRKNPSTYAAWSKDAENRYKSTSGGIFTEIAKQVIKESGVVVGAKYDKNNLVEHAFATNEKELEFLRQSKYVQSDLKNIYVDVKKKLDFGSLVAFCGTPCQIAGLYKFLGKDYNKLLTIEFICRGVNSPKAYRIWLESIEQRESKKITKVWFKYKENGWKKSPKCTRVDFEDETYKIYKNEDNSFMSGYLGPNLYIRLSCGNCQFNGLPRQADITLADFWGIEEKYDDDQGTSLILSNSDLGDLWIDKIRKNVIIHKKDIKDVEKGNNCFTTSIKINSKSAKFLEKINFSNFDDMVKKYSKVSVPKKVYKKLKKIVKK